MAQTVEVSVDEQGQIVIPLEAVGLLGLSVGMTLVAEKADEGGIRLRVEPEAPVLVEKGGVLVVRAEPLGDVAEAVRQERGRRVQELVSRAGL
ncbi:MAG: hypothetical protein HY320_01780 [Armatimonadetes bacterium]|nr:hypothetical protein [Armatimonadota bacterium]